MHFNTMIQHAKSRTRSQAGSDTTKLASPSSIPRDPFPFQTPPGHRVSSLPAVISKLENPGTIVQPYGPPPSSKAPMLPMTKPLNYEELYPKSPTPPPPEPKPKHKPEPEPEPMVAEEASAKKVDDCQHLACP